jgi:hypothetical protein
VGEKEKLAELAPYYLLEIAMIGMALHYTTLRD